MWGVTIIDCNNESAARRPQQLGALGRSETPLGLTLAAILIKAATLPRACASEERKHWKNGTFKGALNFDAPDKTERTRARTHKPRPLIERSRRALSGVAKKIQKS